MSVFLTVDGKTLRSNWLRAQNLVEQTVSSELPQRQQYTTSISGWATRTDSALDSSLLCAVWLLQNVSHFNAVKLLESLQDDLGSATHHRWIYHGFLCRAMQGLESDSTKHSTHSDLGCSGRSLRCNRKVEWLWHGHSAAASTVTLKGPASMQPTISTAYDVHCCLYMPVN